MNIIWSEEAKRVYLEFIDQTIEKFSVKLASEFVEDVEGLIKRIISDNKICPESKIKNLRKCFVNRNISLIYRLRLKKIEIVTLLYNRGATSKKY